MEETKNKEDIKNIKNFKNSKNIKNNNDIFNNNNQLHNIDDLNEEPYDINRAIKEVSKSIEITDAVLDNISQIAIKKLEKYSKENKDPALEQVEETNKIADKIEYLGFFVSLAICIVIIEIMTFQFPKLSSMLMTIYTIIASICVSRISRIIVNEVIKRYKEKNGISKLEEELEKKREKIAYEIVLETKIEECMNSISLLNAILSEEESKRIFIECGDKNINIKSFYENDQLIKKYVNQIINVRKDEKANVFLKLKEK